MEVPQVQCIELIREVPKEARDVVADLRWGDFHETNLVPFLRSYRFQDDTMGHPFFPQPLQWRDDIVRNVQVVKTVQKLVERPVVKVGGRHQLSISCLSEEYRK